MNLLHRWRRLGAVVFVSAFLFAAAAHAGQTGGLWDVMKWDQGVWAVPEPSQGALTATAIVAVAVLRLMRQSRSTQKRRVVGGTDPDQG